MRSFLALLVSSSSSRTRRFQCFSWLATQSSVRRISRSVAQSASWACSPKSTSASRSSLSASIEWTLAPSLMANSFSSPLSPVLGERGDSDPLALLQVFLDSLGLAEQEGDVLASRFLEAVDRLHR